MSTDKRLTLVLGGARGGKSSFAERLARRRGNDVTYVATAEARDDAMRHRVKMHQASRPAHWRTIEAPTGVGRAIAAAGPADVVLLECLTLLASNVIELVGGEDPVEAEAFTTTKAGLQSELADLLEWFHGHNSHLIVVSNEVGLGLVPPYPLGRAYRDLLGWANQWLARQADEVFLLIAGLPVDLKKLGAEFEELGFGTD